MKYRKFLRSPKLLVIILPLASLLITGGILIMRQAEYTPSIFHIASCGEVGIQQPLWANPHTSLTSTQLERRAMIEKRLFDCSWRAYRALLAASGKEKDAKRSQILAKAAEEISEVSEPLRNYMNITTIVLSRDTYSDYYVHQSPDAWSYSNSILDRARRLLAADFMLIAGLDPEVASFLGVTIKDGVVSLDDIPQSMVSIRAELADKQSRQWVGLISNRMTFPTLTPEEISLLDEIQVLHTRWAGAVLEHRPGDEMIRLIEEHHQKHHELEMLAASADQQALFTLAEHSPHDVCSRHTPQELDFLLRQAEQHHQEWVTALKNNDFRSAWIAGLLHARDHVLLATCNLILPELTS